MLAQKRKACDGSEGASTSSSVGQRASLYLDIGDCDRLCEFCGALFWYEERVISASSRGRPVYHQCCRSGSVALPFRCRPFTTLIHLYQQPDFMLNIRTYNSMFSMTSFGGKVDDSINQGAGPYVFKVSGQVYHWIGSLCPTSGERPRFLQMYIYDTENEISNRLRCFTGADASNISAETVRLLSHVLESCNELVKLFRTARDLCNASETPSCSVCLYGMQSTGAYERPSSDCIGAVVTDCDPLCSKFDIVIRYKDGRPQRITKIHPLYMSLQYPLLFPYGDKGWSPELLLRTKDGSRAKMTINKYYSYLLHDRANLYTLLLRGGRLFQQFIVDAYICIEEDRLDYVRQHQNEFRNELLQGVQDAVRRGDTEGRDIGKRTYLPTSFIGGPRYMYKHYQDALAICRVHGNPQYFITFTCNVKWPEIQRYMLQYPTLKAQDRPDIVARVFQMKVKSFVNFLKDSKPFGDVVADLYTIEFQKRGLPHCHLLLWVAAANKIKDASQVDNFISAEIPDPTNDFDLYRIVTDLMIHGPCGIVKPNSPCMSKDSCSKNFPKQYHAHTSFDNKGNVHYKRSSNGFTINKGGLEVDSRFVVPYNPVLCRRFMAHINVEYCGWSMLIKYLFKYISKGADRIHYKIAQSPAIVNADNNNEPSYCDEIQNFLDGRFVCPHEAAWRIFNYSIHDRNPPVQVLAVHLENMQNMSFKDNDSLHTVQSNSHAKRTTLTEWLLNNQTDSSGRHLRYVDYLKEYRWDLSPRCWVRRKTMRTPAIGRLRYVHPTCGETFYLRLLLGHQRGCQSYSCIRSVNGEVCATNREACERLGLLGDDKEWLYTFDEAAVWASASELRSLFVQMLLYCDISDPVRLWNTQWHKMADDGQRLYGLLNTDDMSQFVLYELELLLRSGSVPSSLSEFGLPMPNPDLAQRLRNKLLMEERNYDRDVLASEHVLSISKLNVDQRRVYEHIMLSVSEQRQCLLFVYGHGGTGKTFLWATILAGLRSSGKIALAVAASGIASLLLPSGRTAHSRFKIPLDLTDESICNIKKGTQLAQLISETTLIIWDEAPMNDRRCYESLDRSLRDLMNNIDQPFGGKSVVLGGDFRQTLPVIPRSSKAVLLASTLPRSYLWQHFMLYRLTVNMRLERPYITTERKNLVSAFSTWLVAIGDGQVGVPDADDPINVKKIRIPSQYLIPYTNTALEELIEFIYDIDTLRHPSTAMLSTKAIVCPKNDTVDEINAKIIGMTDGIAKTYVSVDSVVPNPGTCIDIDSIYPTEYLNLLNFSGFPSHTLHLKLGAPIILLRNLNPLDGLCNGTRLMVTQLLPHIIEAQIITGKFIGKRVYLPKITLIHKDKELPFEFKRKQFPIRLCYAMTINKSQGQSLDKIGVYLPHPVFAHGQLYVALSRATTPESLKIVVVPQPNDNHDTTTNIVYTDFLDEINNSC